MNEQQTEVPTAAVISSLQSQIADQALRIALLEARLSAAIEPPTTVASNGEAKNYAHDT
jgi:hypothetical protein